MEVNAVVAIISVSVAISGAAIGVYVKINEGVAELKTIIRMLADQIEANRKSADERLTYIERNALRHHGE